MVHTHFVSCAGAHTMTDLHVHLHINTTHHSLLDSLLTNPTSMAIWLVPLVAIYRYQNQTGSPKATVVMAGRTSIVEKLVSRIEAALE